MTFYQIGAPESQTDQAPAVALTDWPDGIPDSRVFVVWKKASSNTIWYSSSTDNIHWTPPLQIQGNGWQAYTDAGPALVLAGAFSGPGELLYAAWKGESTDKIWYSTTKDGVTWSEQQAIPGTFTTAKPALAQNTISGTGGPVAVAWLAADGSINYSFSPSGISPTWSSPATLSSAGKIKIAPGLGSVSTGSLVFSWADNDNTLWYQLVPGPAAVRVAGSGFTSESGAAPSIPTQTGYAGLACKGNGDTSLWVVKEFPVPPLTQQRVTDAFTNYAPAWAGLGFVLVFSADNLIVDDIPVQNLTIWACIP